MSSSLSPLSLVESNWKWTQALLEKRAYCSSTVEKVCLFVANFFVVATEGVRNLVSHLISCSSISAKKLEQSPNKQQFADLYSWDAYFKKTPFDRPLNWNNVFSLTPSESPRIDDTASRRIRTDGEPDDIMFFMEELFALTKYIQENNSIPLINKIVSEGDSHLLDLKIETLQLVMCSMVDQGLVDPRVLHAFRFFKEADQKISDQKYQGFLNIFAAAAQTLRNDRVCLLMGQIVQQEYSSVEILHKLENHMQARSITSAGAEPVIREIVIAPIDGFVKHYAERPDQLQFVNEEGYGSFNLNEAVERFDASLKAGSNDGTPQSQADRVVQTLAGCRNVFNFEAFPATKSPVVKDGIVQKDKEGREVYSDFNRIGPITDPDIFAPFTNQPSSLLKFIGEAMRGWNKPTIEKMLASLRSMQGGEKFVDAFIDGFEPADQESTMPLDQALQLCDQHISSSVVAKAKVYVKIVHNIMSNRGLQGTLSDFTYALIKSDPSLVRDECLFKATVSLEKQNGRLNTVFQNNDKGNAFAIESDTEARQTGLDIPRVKSAIINFFTRLSPQAAIFA